MNNDCKTCQYNTDEVKALKAQNAKLVEALEESVKLQAHYAELLNMHDGGERIIFKTVNEWLERLQSLKD